jgi:ABC-2 type transport system permease protein
MKTSDWLITTNHWRSHMDREIWIVARREVALKFKSKVIAFSAIVILAISAASPWISHFANTKPQVLHVGVLPESSLTPSTLKSAAANVKSGDAITFRFHLLKNLATVERLLKSNKYSVVIGKDGNRSTFLINSHTSPAAVTLLKSITQQISLQEFLAYSNVSITDMAQFLSGRESLVTSIKEDKKPVDYSVAIFALVLLYMILSLSGGFLALTIIEEKSGRIMEVLLSSISARILLLGKILGVLLFSVAQFSLVVATWVISSNLAGSAVIRGTSISQIAFYLLWFIPAILAYSFLYGGLGALITRSEDAGAIQGPMSILLIASVYSAVYSLTSPDNSIVKVAMLIPPFNFFLAPARYLTTGEIEGSMIVGYLIAIAFTAAAIYLAISLFEANVLNNKKFSLKRAIATSQSKAIYT